MLHTTASVLVAIAFGTVRRATSRGRQKLGLFRLVRLQETKQASSPPPTVAGVRSAGQPPLTSGNNRALEATAAIFSKHCIISHHHHTSPHNIYSSRTSSGFRDRLMPQQPRYTRCRRRGHLIAVPPAATPTDRRDSDSSDRNDCE